MRSGNEAAKMAEAAQANQGGLECASYTWQVRQCVCACCVAGIYWNHLSHAHRRLAQRLEMPAFVRTIGIDYSGAETANSSLKGLRVYLAEHDAPPVEVPPPPSPRRYWTRRGIAEWLVQRLAEDAATLVRIDHR